MSKNIKLAGEITVPGDKSISHRSIMLGAIAKGDTHITGFLEGADCLSTIDCFKKMGVEIIRNKDTVLVHGKGMRGLSTPSSILDVGNSGTTTRLMSGILCAQNFTSHVNGDASIQKRPMSRIITPLSLMGADIKSDLGNNCTPLTINGKALNGIDYQSPVASAQVKSSILLAGLYANGTTSVTEPMISRNHTELMLKAFGGNIIVEGKKASVSTTDELFGQEILVPGDISSAAYFITAGLITKNDGILIKNVGINPTRDGILKVYKAMGGNISIENRRVVAGEEVADLVVRTSELKGTVIEGDIIPTLIDEIPVIAIAAAFANGTTIIKDAKELRVKESDRIAVMSDNLTAIGVDVTATEDGLIINGGKEVIGGTIDSHLDHRIAMSFAIANLVSQKDITILGRECVNISYPTFYEDLESLIQ